MRQREDERGAERALDGALRTDLQQRREAARLHVALLKGELRRLQRPRSQRQEHPERRRPARRRLAAQQRGGAHEDHASGGGQVAGQLASEPASPWPPLTFFSDYISFSVAPLFLFQYVFFQ